MEYMHLIKEKLHGWSEAGLRGASNALVRTKIKTELPCRNGWTSPSEEQRRPEVPGV